MWNHPLVPRSEPRPITRQNLKNLRMLAIGVVIVAIFVIATQLGVLGGENGNGQLIVIMAVLLAGAAFLLVKISQALQRDDLP
ncbi:hypothetical protein BH10ACT3_BH10ACT3_22050 [soil metagenome]